jgi:hypothetical protein
MKRILLLNEYVSVCLFPTTSYPGKAAKPSNRLIHAEKLLNDGFDSKEKISDSVRADSISLLSSSTISGWSSATFFCSPGSAGILYNSTVVLPGLKTL